MPQVNEVQMMDYFLKRIVADNEHALHGKNLKLVARINDDLWTGDFVKLDGFDIARTYIDEVGDVTETPLAVSISPTISKVRNVYFNFVKKGFSNPFKKLSDTPVLLQSLIEIVSEANIKTDKYELEPVLYNAYSLKSKVSLPFLALKHSNIEVVSIIDLDEYGK
ncbi:hypothetical protein EVU96_09025 [Bacillus infantis]|uniref:hypothetical protein n=1 Tax=Bacillus infantis TaxID=324767 RepID=UPI00101D0378|nr:hypothetical protein [Bacillus infantis]RYI30547.1 hypothetical protein EVU96_09025 [Bacillus infantis]